jgi:hypothetical protein
MRWCVVLAACGSSAAPPQKPAPVAAPPSPPPAAAMVDDQAKRDEIVAAHRKIEEEQQEALAAMCDDKDSRDKHQRCFPSCYATETPDPRAGKKMLGAVEIRHLACEKPSGGYALADELDVKLAVRPVRGRFPTPHKQGTWQADVEAALGEPKLPKGDVVVVTGKWRDVAHPLTKEKLRCVAVSRYTRLHRPLDGCGGDGSATCEATGNPATRAINVVHYRLAEARVLQAAGKTDDCQQAALEAVAVARGLPRWRQYAKLNVKQWVAHAAYRTRFDGTFDEDALVAAAIGLGTEAEGVYVECGGPRGAPTTAAQEQSFHTCW